MATRCLTYHHRQSDQAGRSRGGKQFLFISPSSSTVGGIRVRSISLREVDGVHVTTLMDNSRDVLLPDEGGLVRRWG